MSGPSGPDEGAVVANRYRVHEKVGAGGMGVVYRATDTRLRREVALKRVLLRGVDDDEAAEVRRRTLREAEIAARIHHPRIVSIFDVLDDTGGPLLVLEYLPSRSLGTVVADGGVLTPAVAARVGAQVAEGLAAAHAAGVVHRDVKPGNVLVAAGHPVGPVKLADFGISQVTGSGSMTATGIGTPAYFAPEIARGEPPGPASDVYALGATLCTVVQGAPPFGYPDGNPLDLIRRIGQEPVPSPTVGGPLGELLGRMTAADPADRPDAATAAADLRRLADRPEPEHPVAMPPTPGPHGEPGSRHGLPTELPADHRSLRRRRVLLAGGGVLAVVAVGAGVVVATGGGDDSSPTLPAALTAMTIDDPRTADPCSLVRTEALVRYGTPVPEPDYGTFASCRIAVDPGRETGYGVSTTFGPRSGTPPEGEQQRIGEALVVRPPAQDGGCGRHLVLADGTPIQIFVDHDGAVPADDCTVAETALASVATTLAGSGVGRRALPPGPLWSTDACALLGPADLAFLPPDRRGVAVRGFGDWQCQWNEGTDDGRRVTVLFDRLDPPSETGRRAPGTPAFVSDTVQEGRCNVEVPNRPYIGSAGSPLTEEIRMRVEGDEPRQELCDRGVALATAASGRVPG